MDMYVRGNNLMVSATNLPDFNALLKRAEKEAEQLKQTLDQLSRFDFAIQFSIRGENYAGDIDPASSVMSIIPTK